jgi:LmbE family N-acetylglucosaminyl deacetylase
VAGPRSEAEWGFEAEYALDRVLVLSPHLDDAVMSCGAFLVAHPGATVATLFAASPPTYAEQLNEHDLACGFQPGDDTMAVRRGEDARALAAVGARPRWLDFCQNSHVARVDPLAIPAGALEAVEDLLAELAPTTVVAPLGLLHADHQALHATALAAQARAVPDIVWVWYSDLPYVYIPTVLSARLRALYKAGFIATPACPPLSNDFAAKWRAFREYATQQPAMDAPWRLRDRLERAGESYWTLASFA